MSEATKVIEYKVKVFSMGTKMWHLNEKLHREDGPAVEYSNGTDIWYLNGKLHREDGPAFAGPLGTKLWFLNDIEYTEEEYKRKMKPAKKLTIEEISKLLGYEVEVVK